MNEFKTILLTTFQWLTEAEAETAASYLAAVTADRLTAKAQMIAYGHELESMGITVTAQLLMSLAGRGSKTAAVEVVRDLVRDRFERAMALKASEPVKRLTGEIPPTSFFSTTSGMPADSAQSPTPLGNAEPEILEHLLSLSKRLDGIDQETLAFLKRVDGNVTWLKSTIDTERQLSRYRKQFGPLEEPRATAIAETPEQKRTVIGNLTSTLQGDYRKAAGRAVPEDAAIKGEGNSLDL